MFQSKNYHKPEDVLSIGDMLSLWKEVIVWCNIEEVNELDEFDNPTGDMSFYINAPENHAYFRILKKEYKKLGWRKRFCYPLEWYNRVVNAIQSNLPFKSDFWRELTYTICLQSLLRAYQGRYLDYSVLARPAPFEWINAQYKKYEGNLPPLDELEKYQSELFADLSDAVHAPADDTKEYRETIVGDNKVETTSDNKTFVDLRISDNAKKYCEALVGDNDVETSPDNKTLVDLRNYLLNPRFWDYDAGGKVHYTCHDYAFSDSVEDDICRKCSQATCNYYSSDEYPMIYVEPERLILKQDIYIRFLVDNYFPLNESFIHEYVIEGTMRTMKDNIVYESEDYAFFLINEVRSPVKDESLLPLAKEFYELLFKIHRASEDFDLKKEDE